MKRSSSVLKSMAREAMNGKYGFLVAAYLLTMLCLILPNIIITLVLQPSGTMNLISCQVLLYLISLVSALVMTGFKYTLLNISRGRNFDMADLFYAFSHHPDRFLMVSLLFTLAQVLVSLPFTISFYSMDSTAVLNTQGLLLNLAEIIAGSLIALIMNLFFCMSEYLLLDNMDMSAMEALKGSIRLMKGNKGRFFCLDMSFIPLSVVCIFTCYLGFLWLGPYMQAAYVQLYLDVTGELDKPEPEPEIPEDSSVLF